MHFDFHGLNCSNTDLPYVRFVSILAAKCLHIFVVFINMSLIDL